MNEQFEATSARRLLRAARRSRTDVYAFRDGFFSASYAEIKDRFEALAAEGAPNLYVPLSRTAGRSKVRHLLTAFATQRTRRWFTADIFESLLRLRGIEAGAPEGYAEAFHAHKALFEP